MYRSYHKSWEHTRHKTKSFSSRNFPSGTVSQLLTFGFRRLLEDCPLHSRMLSNILDLYTLDANCDNQKCLKTLTNVPWGVAKLFSDETHCCNVMRKTYNKQMNNDTCYNEN